jgi:hypothetical protein
MAQQVVDCDLGQFRSGSGMDDLSMVLSFSVTTEGSQKETQKWRAALYYSKASKYDATIF